MSIAPATRVAAVGFAVAVVPAALLAQKAATPPAPSATIKTYCVSCHSGRTPVGRVSFDQLDARQPARDPGTWERVVRQLRARTMPPMGSARPDGNTYESTIAALTSALDRGARAVAPATDRQLAERLATLIWSGEPDQPLRDAAANGTLREPQVLQAQVRRMLGDEKAAALVSGFFDSWLSLDQLSAIKRDSKVVPELDDELLAAFRRETDLFIASQLRDDDSPLDLWTADYTFLNEKLARHYGIPTISGSEYRRVTWAGPERAGLLTQGSVLTLTSYPFNAYPVDQPTTSPAQRAKWVLTRFLGVNPPTPLPGVPGPDYPFEKHTPLVKQSRAFPATPCVACHRSFFPLSYGLENFDLLGRWRDNYGSEPIDASGTMVDGTRFNGPEELLRALLERRDAFLNTITERLMAYAAGGEAALKEGPTAERMPAVRAALREAETRNYAWSALIAAMAKASPAPAQ